MVGRIVAAQDVKVGDLVRAGEGKTARWYPVQSRERWGVYGHGHIVLVVNRQNYRYEPLAEIEVQ